jgi:hypothetical protein
VKQVRRSRYDSTRGCKPVVDSVNNSQVTSLRASFSLSRVSARIWSRSSLVPSGNSSIASRCGPLRRMPFRTGASCLRRRGTSLHFSDHARCGSEISGFSGPCCFPAVLVQGMASPTEFGRYVASPQGSSKGYGDAWKPSCERPERDFWHPWPFSTGPNPRVPSVPTSHLWHPWVCEYSPDYGHWQEARQSRTARTRIRA